MKEHEPPFPVVLARPQHCLSRKQIDPDARKVMVRLTRHGFMAYLVGGSVRDLLLGKQPKDFDISTDAHPGQIRKLFRNSRSIGRRFRLVHIFFRGNKILEVSTFRRTPPEPPPDGNGAEVAARKSDNTFGEPHEDAMRRDLTINGLFYDISTFSIIDYVGGIEDLNAGIIRVIGNPEEKFREDPLRMVRAVRHKTRTGFRTEQQTYDAILRFAPRVKDSNPSRLQDEFQKDLDSGFFCPVLHLQNETGILASYFPELVRYLNRPQVDERALFNSAWFWNALALLDAPSEEDISAHRFRLASLLFPLLERHLLEQYPTLSESLQNSGETHRMLGDCCLPIGIPRRDREGLKTLWAGWLRLLRFLASEKIPVRFQKKPYFEEVLKWHRFHQSAADRAPEETQEMLRRAIRTGRATMSRRRRRRRKNR